MMSSIKWKISSILASFVTIERLGKFLYSLCSEIIFPANSRIKVRLYFSFLKIILFLRIQIVQRIVITFSKTCQCFPIAQFILPNVFNQSTIYKLVLIVAGQLLLVVCHILTGMAQFLKWSMCFSILWQKGQLPLMKNLVPKFVSSRNKKHILNEFPNEKLNFQSNI